MTSVWHNLLKKKGRIVPYQRCTRFPRLTVSVPDYGSLTDSQRLRYSRGTDRRCQGCFNLANVTLFMPVASSDTHRCSAALNLIFDCRKVRGVLSVNTVKVKYSRYSRNFSVTTAHLRSGSSSFLEEQLSMFLSAPPRPQQA